MLPPKVTGWLDWLRGDRLKIFSPIFCQQRKSIVLAVILSGSIFSVQTVHAQLTRGTGEAIGHVIKVLQGINSLIVTSDKVDSILQAEDRASILDKLSDPEEADFISMKELTLGTEIISTGFAEELDGVKR